MRRWTQGFLWIACWVLVCAPSLWAQTRLRFAHIDGEQGLSHNTVTGILHDRAGYMWFSTVDGLNRYDGVRCQVFRHDPADPQSLPSNFIHGVLERKNGELWVATRDAGLARLAADQRERFAFQHFPALPGVPGKLTHPLVQAMHEDRQQRLWIGTAAGLDLFLPETGSFRHLALYQDGDRTVSSMVEDERGLLWIATFNGLYLFDSNALANTAEGAPAKPLKVFRHRPGDANALPDNLLNAVFRDRAGNLWLRVRGHGLSRLNPHTETFKHYFFDPNRSGGLPSPGSNVSYEDETGLLWIATGQGLATLDPRTDRFTVHRRQPSLSSSLSSDNVTRIYRGHDGQPGSLWVTTWGGGVNLRVDDRKLFELVQHDPEDPRSLSNDFIFAMHEDRFGDLWVGTIGGGLNRRRQGESTWERYVHQDSDPDSLADNAVWSIFEDPDGHLWICTEKGGVDFLARPSADAPVRFRHLRADGSPTGLLSDNIKIWYQDTRGNRWAGSNDLGLGLLPAGARAWQQLKADGSAASLSGNQICSLLERDGQLWIGTRDHGLNRYDGQRFWHYRHKADDPRSLAGDDVRTLCLTRKGELWVGSYGGGVSIYQPETDDFRRLSLADGLVNDFIYGICEDQEGFLWLSTNRGLACYDPAKRSFSHFSMLDGLQSDEFNTGAFCRGADGRLYFGGVSGFNAFQPRVLRATLAARARWRPPVVLTRLARMGQALDLSRILPGPLRLAHADKFFAFEWAVLDYRDATKNRFAYRLEGFDRDWIDNGHRNYASYTNLDPGHYRLHLKGAGPSGPWSEAAPLEIVIAPPFWQTWWFRLGCLALAALALVAGFRIREYYQTWRGIKFIGPYKLLRKLGEGGSGTVYLARNRLTRAEVALKVLHDKVEEAPDGVRRFVQEAEIGARLTHPNVVAILESGSQGKTRYIAMEYLEGRTLRELVDQRLSVDVAEVQAVADQILQGLAAVHAQLVVHRDLKAANVMVLPTGQVKLMDFGLARLHTLTTVENRDQLMGTLAYMSPEQTLGKSVDRRSDLYSFGVLLFELIHGRLPYLCQNQMELIFAIHNEDPPNLTLTDPALIKLDRIARKCMEKEPRDRYASVEEIQVDLA